MAKFVDMETMLDMRKGFIKQMHNYIGFHINDEDAYGEWIQLVPDKPDEEDFTFIANDEELWVSVCTLFGKLVKRYEGR